MLSRWRVYAPFSLSFRAILGILGIFVIICGLIPLLTAVYGSSSSSPSTAFVPLEGRTSGTYKSPPSSFASLQQRAVFHGPYDFAFQPSIICAYFKKTGFPCVSADYAPHPFGDRVDIHFRDCDEVCWRSILAKLDILHFHEFVPYGGLFEIENLRRQGKCVIFQTHGTEYRPLSAYLKANKFSSDDSSYDVHKTWGMGVPDEKVHIKMKWLRSAANAVITGDYELAGFENYTTVVPRVIDLHRYDYVGVSDSPNPLVIHAPSNRWVKGSDWILEAVNLLHEEGLEFEYRELTGMKQVDVMSVMKQADIVLDQFRVGWYGVFATEGMAMGKAIVSYVRPDLHKFVGDPPAVVFAVKETIADALRRLLLDIPFRQEMGIRSRKFVEAEHDIAVQAVRIHALYEEVCYRNPPPLNKKEMDLLKQNELLQEIADFHY